MEEEREEMGGREGEEERCGRRREKERMITVLMLAFCLRMYRTEPLSPILFF